MFREMDLESEPYIENMVFLEERMQTWVWRDN